MSTFSKAFFSLNSESINITWTQLAVLYIYYFNLQTVLYLTHAITYQELFPQDPKKLVLLKNRKMYLSWNYSKEYITKE